MCKILNKKIIYNIHLRRSCTRVGGNIAMCIGRGDVIVQCQWGSLALMRPVVKGKKLLCEAFVLIHCILLPGESLCLL